MDGSLYKRRKLHGTSVALLSEEKPTTTKLSIYNYNLCSDDNHFTTNKDNLGCSLNSLDKGNPLIVGQHCLHKPAAIFSPSDRSVSNCVPNDICMIREDKVYAEAAKNYPENSAKKHPADLNGKCSLSNGNVECSSASTNMKKEVKDAGESPKAVKEALGEFTSVKELCISVLKSHGLLGEQWNPSANSSKLPSSNDPSPSQPCKICGCLDDPLKLLICDLCEETFHPSCCDPKVKVLPVDDWYCQPCFRKKPKPFLQTHDWRRQSYGDLVSFMLKDTQPYTTGVRVGKDFQVELPDWSGPNSVDHDYFDEHSELDPTEFTNLNGWNSKMSNFIGNWVQCREVVDTNENGREIICGKWRRAPLFLQLTDDWDCSCAVTWDPVHADCAVPQELPTSEEWKQLKFIEKAHDLTACPPVLCLVSTPVTSSAIIGDQSATSPRQSLSVSISTPATDEASPEITLDERINTGLEAKIQVNLQRLIAPEIPMHARFFTLEASGACQTNHKDYFAVHVVRLNDAYSVGLHLDSRYPIEFSGICKH